LKGQGVKRQNWDVVHRCDHKRKKTGRLEGIKNKHRKRNTQQTGTQASSYSEVSVGRWGLYGN